MFDFDGWNYHNPDVDNAMALANQMLADTETVQKEMAALTGEYYKKGMERTKKEKPYAYCVPGCEPDMGMCEECIQKQKEFEKAMQNLERLENGDASGFGTTKKLAAKCSLCGAARDKSLSECPFCSTPYVDEEIPVQNAGAGVDSAALLKAAEETYKHYEWVKVHSFDVLTKADADYYEKMKVLYKRYPGQNRDAEYEENLRQSTMKQMAKIPMNAQQIQKGAETYQMSISGYLWSVAKNEAQTMSHIEQEERERAIRQQEREIDRQAREKIAANRRQELQRQSDFMSRKITPYNGGSGGSSGFGSFGGGGGGSTQCCGSCALYMPGAARCSLDPDSHFQKNATDFCGSYRSR